MSGMTRDEFNNVVEQVSRQYFTMNNIKTISERIEERTRRELENEAMSAFREVDRWIRQMPSDYCTKVIGDVEYSDVRKRIVDLIVAARLPDRVDAAILQFMRKVEDTK